MKMYIIQLFMYYTGFDSECLSVVYFSKRQQHNFND